MKKYDPNNIEKKWQKFWLENKIFVTPNKAKGDKKFVLIEFPYPSGAGLHMGHMRPFIAGDVVSKYWRLKGFNTMYPVGWDAFGLPAENYAIKNKVHPSISTEKNIKNAKKQMISWGTSFDWSREINSTDPEYYKWTQWLFIQFFKKDLAYEATGLINWCPSCKTGLANEEVIDGSCERCGTTVEKKELRQWYLRITAYAEKLLEGLKELPEWPNAVKLQQENWIGRSEGVNFKCKVKDTDIILEMYDSIPQTHMAQTFTIIAANHPLLPALVKGTPTEKEVLEFAKKISDKKDKAGFNHIDEMEGIFTGRYVEFEPNGKSLPIWVASYAVAEYGTGIVNCSAHDERDFNFAKKYNIPLHPVLFPADNEELKEKIKNLEVFYREPDGILEEPDQFKGRRWDEARQDIIDHVVKKGWAERKVNYKLRDWVFSRQRYWGEPIPLIHCEKCGVVPVPDKDLPVILPKVKNYEPTGTGESPLAAIDKWVNTTCPKCEGKAKRETNTMPQWAGSSWYWLRYADPKNKKEFADKELLKYWSPVDLYYGGMEHTTLHLLYSRFWNQFLFDEGLVTSKEPYQKRIPHGIVLGPDGEKMSKSRGNVVNPDEIVKLYGADTTRLYMQFLGPHGAQVAWNDKGIIGTRRFLERVFHMDQFITKNESEEITRELHKTIRKVGQDIEVSSFNTSISQMMIFVNKIYEKKEITKKSFEEFLIVLSPFAPHLTEELWKKIGNKKTIFESKWPEYDEKILKEDIIKIPVQINGKVRSTIEVENDASDNEIESIALQDEKIKQFIEGKDIKKVIIVKGKIISIVL